MHRGRVVIGQRRPAMKTVIGLFDNFSEARETLHDLVSSGFSVDDISILANGLLGQSVDAPGIDHLERMRVQGIGEIAAFGPLVHDIELHNHEELESDVLVRALSETGVPVETAQSFVDGVRRGGTLETVKVDDDDVDRVVAIMKLHASSGVAREDIVLEEMYEETVPDEIGEEEDSNAGAASPSSAEPLVDEPFEPIDKPFSAAAMDDALNDLPKDEDSPAHKFGQSLRSDERFAGNDWSTVEGHAKETWEAKNPDTWEHIKDVVRHAWEKVRGKA